MAILVQGKVMMAICRASGAELVERFPQLFALSNERGKLKLGFDGSRPADRVAKMNLNLLKHMLRSADIRMEQGVF
jgi:hypothetical protein